MKEFTDRQIVNALKIDSIGRNQQLSILMKFFNSFDSNTVISIDGPWGSGKTVFVKQLKMLSESDQIELPDHGPSIDINALKKFRDKYSVYYFNAWEHDYLSDPLEALLYRLINDFSKNESMNTAKKVANKLDLAGLVKNISKDAIDLESMTTNEQLTAEIKTIINRKDSVDKILEKYLDTSNKRMLFIIDELDRCRPSFAVELLETIKHYFDNDRIVFLIASNASELKHTIKKFYGIGFDGAKYLNRFFGYSVGLNSIDREKYITAQLGVKKDDHFKNSIPHDIATYLDLTMREIDSFFTPLKLLDNYMSRNNHWQPGAKAWLTQVVFVPLALALRTTQDARYEEFVNGKGADVLNEFCSQSKKVFRLAESLIENKNNMSDETLKAFIKSTYLSLFKDGDGSDGKLQRDEFHDVINLVSSYASIGDQGDEVE